MLHNDRIYQVWCEIIHSSTYPSYRFPAISGWSFSNFLFERLCFFANSCQKISNILMKTEWKFFYSLLVNFFNTKQYILLLNEEVIIPDLYSLFSFLYGTLKCWNINVTCVPLWYQPVFKGLKILLHLKVIKLCTVDSVVLTYLMLKIWHFHTILP